MSGSTMVVLDVSGMTCGGCVEAVKRVIRKVDSTAVVAVDLATGRVEATTSAEAHDLAAAVTKAGYEARPAL